MHRGLSNSSFLEGDYLLIHASSMQREFWCILFNGNKSRFSYLFFFLSSWVTLEETGKNRALVIASPFVNIKSCLEWSPARRRNPWVTGVDYSFVGSKTRSHETSLNRFPLTLYSPTTYCIRFFLKNWWNLTAFVWNASRSKSVNSLKSQNQKREWCQI